MDKLYALRVIKSEEDMVFDFIAFSHEPRKLKDIIITAGYWIENKNPMCKHVFHTDPDVFPQFFIEEVSFII